MPLPKADSLEQRILKFLIKQPNRTATIQQLRKAAGKNFPLIHILQCMVEWNGLDVRAPDKIEENYDWS